MVSDLERFLELYKSFGIELNPEVEDSEHSNGSDTVTLILEVRKNPKFTGYEGFYSDITFNADGKFLEQGFWE